MPLGFVIFLLIAVLAIGFLLGVYTPQAWNAAIKAACAKLVAEEQALGGDLSSLLTKLTTKKAAKLAPAVLTANEPEAAPAPAPVPEPAAAPALAAAPVAPGKAA